MFCCSLPVCSSNNFVIEKSAKFGAERGEDESDSQARGPGGYSGPGPGSCPNRTAKPAHRPLPNLPQRTTPTHAHTNNNIELLSSTTIYVLHCSEGQRGNKSVILIETILLHLATKPTVVVPVDSLRSSAKVQPHNLSYL